MLKDYNRKIVYSYQNITNDSIFWIRDVFESDNLNKMLHNRTPAYIVNDHFVAVEPLEYRIYSVPLWWAKNTRLIVKHLSQNQNYTTRHIFNFMINKKQINRFLCMKLVELFKLTNYDYTWSGVDFQFDMTLILNELESLGKKVPFGIEERSILLSKIKIPKKFFYSPESVNNSFVSYPNNSWTWNNGLNEIFCSSAVSLITESLRFTKSTVFTEKTTYALLGKTFPIWVGGGIAQAQQLENMGFDVFNDVINHNYQFYDTLIERCYYAFKLNLHILTNYEYVSKIRESMMDRLEHNQQLLKNMQIDNFCKQKIKDWPLDLQQSIQGELHLWIKG